MPYMTYSDDYVIISDDGPTEDDSPTEHGGYWDVDASYWHDDMGDDPEPYSADTYTDYCNGRV